MSLKNFHVLFIAAAVLLALFCGLLAFDRFRASGAAGTAAAGVASLAAAIVLVRYEAAFLRQCRLRGIR